MVCGLLNCPLAHLRIPITKTMFLSQRREICQAYSTANMTKNEEMKQMCSGTQTHLSRYEIKNSNNSYLLS